MIEERIAREYLSRVRDIKQSRLFFDVHAHPFELFFGEARYTKHPTLEGVYSTDPQKFKAPQATEILLPDDAETPGIRRLLMRAGMARLNLARLYASIGRGLFEMHMDLTGIDKVLLLPVLRPNDDIDTQMSLMKAMYGNNKRFVFGWCVPASIMDEEIFAAAQDARLRFDIRAVKLHPNVMEIDPQSTQGRRRIEATLLTCGEVGLPLFVHGGRSPLLGDGKTSSLASVRNLKRIDWSISRYPVVMCHAGTYGCGQAEMEEALQELGRMSAKHDNLFVDVSALEIGTIARVIQQFDSERILFGSDMLYETQWIMMVKLLVALERVTSHPEDILMKIAGTVPQKYIFPAEPAQGDRDVLTASQPDTGTGSQEWEFRDAFVPSR